jgi:hypothetical protein
MKQPRELIRRTAWTLALMAGLPAVWVAAEHIYGRIALERYKQQLRAQGERLTLAELGLPPTPLENNAAPALLAAAEELQALSKVCPVASRGVPAMRTVAPGRAEVLWQQLEIRSPTQTNTWEELAADLARGDDPLNRVKEALRQPAVMVEIEYDYSRGPSHYSLLRNAARWLLAAAVYDLRQGNLDDAVENIAAATSLANMLKHERLVISQLVRMAIDAIATGTIWEALQATDWTDEQLARLQHALESDDLMPDLLESWEVERVMASAVFEQLRSERTSLYKDFNTLYGQDSFARRLLSDDDSEGASAFAVWCRAMLWYLAWSHQDELRTMRDWQTLIDQARIAAANPPRHPLPSEGEETRHGFWYSRWKYSVSRIFNPQPLDGAMARAWRQQTEQQMVITAIALKRYQLRAGKWPDDLAALTPEFLSDLPRDHMDGQPLRYRKNVDGTFLLYSAGVNGVDDGGDPAPLPEHADSYWMWRAKDAVWPWPARQP